MAAIQKTQRKLRWKNSVFFFSFLLSVSFFLSFFLSVFVVLPLFFSELSVYSRLLSVVNNKVQILNLALNQLHSSPPGGALNPAHPAFLSLSLSQLVVVKQEDRVELTFKHFLVEDKSTSGGASYVDFLCHMHKEIRQLLS